jgi:hypothetical protein
MTSAGADDKESMNTKEIEIYMTNEANALARKAVTELMSNNISSAIDFAKRATKAASVAEILNDFSSDTNGTNSTEKATTAKRGRPVGSKNRPKAPAVVVATRRTSTTDKPASATQTETLRKILDRTVKGMKAGQTVAGIVSGAQSIIGRAISTKERNTLVGLIGQMVKSGTLVADEKRSTSTIKIWQLNRNRS